VIRTFRGQIAERHVERDEAGWRQPGAKKGPALQGLSHALEWTRTTTRLTPDKATRETAARVVRGRRRRSERPRRPSQRSST
jgi:hypothetical protein